MSSRRFGGLQAQVSSHLPRAILLMRMSSANYGTCWWEQQWWSQTLCTFLKSSTRGCRMLGIVSRLDAQWLDEQCKRVCCSFCIFSPCTVLIVLFVSVPSPLPLALVCIFLDCYACCGCLNQPQTQHQLPAVSELQFAMMMMLLLTKQLQQWPMSLKDNLCSA